MTRQTPVLAILAFATCAVVGQAVAPIPAKPPYVTVNDQPVRFPDMQPRFMNNHAMVPLRGVFERMHARVDWDAQLQRVTCTKDDATVQLVIGDNQATVNGAKITFDAPAILTQGRTLVPLRFLAQSLGAQVEWDDRGQTVRISTPKMVHQKD